MDPGGGGWWSASGGSESRGVCIGGGSAWEGALHPGGVGGGAASGGLPDPPYAYRGGQTPSPVNRMTHRCKNITLPQIPFAGGKNIQNVL